MVLVQSQHGRPLGVDVRGHRWALQHRDRAATSLAIAITTTGAGPVAYLLVAGTGAAHAGPSRWGRGAILAVLALLAAQALRVAVATWIGRPRPPAADWAWHAGGPALPSGHTTTSALVAAMLIAALAHSGRRRTRGLWQPAAVLWAVAVGASRVYLGAHWPTDVVAGWLLALTLILLAAGAYATTWGHYWGRRCPAPLGPGQPLPPGPAGTGSAART